MYLPPSLDEEPSFDNASLDETFELVCAVSVTVSVTVSVPVLLERDELDFPVLSSS